MQPTLPKSNYSGSRTQHSNAEWVLMEHLDPDGNVVFPRNLIENSANRRYADVGSDTKLYGKLLTAHRPKPIFIVEQKIYEVHQRWFDDRRKRGQLDIDIEKWRAHEREWFAAMSGIKLKVIDVPPGVQSNGAEYKVVSTRFVPKEVSIQQPDGTHQVKSMFHATIRIKETWSSTWRRKRASLTGSVLLSMIIPFSVTVGAGAVLLWYQDRSLDDDTTLRPVESTGETSVNEKSKVDFVVPQRAESLSSSSKHEASSKDEDRRQALGQLKSEESQIDIIDLPSEIGDLPVSE